MAAMNLSSNDLASSVPLQGMHILLCDDCIDQRRMILKILQQLGAEVTLECNGLSAVNTVQKYPARFDAIVMDFQMPEMDGLVATQKLRGMKYSGPIIAVTGFGTEQLKSSWFEAGCNDYLTKPLDGVRLLNSVAQSLEAATA